MAPETSPESGSGGEALDNVPGTIVSPEPQPVEESRHEPFEAVPACPTFCGGGDQVGQYWPTGRPAVTVYHPDGTPKFEWWFLADEAHREDGPACIHYGRDGSRLERWYRHNQRHRTDGPAIVERDGAGAIRRTEWWLAGEAVTVAAEAFLAETGARWPFDPATETRFLERMLRRSA
jgi:hypothetical protein